MSNKEKQWNQNRHLTLRIANIKFSIFHRPPHKKTSSNQCLLSPNEHKTPTEKGEPRLKGAAVSRNSFIPSTSIKSQVQADRSRQYAHTPLFPADVTYSKFPLRRPKTIKPRTYFPIFRERIVSCTPERALNLSQLSLQGQTEVQTIGKRNRVIHSRAATKSCLILNQNSKEKEREQEKETFVRYSYLNSHDVSEYKGNNSARDEEQIA